MTGLTPDIIHARVLRHGVLALTFADGLSGDVAVLERMRGPVFDIDRTDADGLRAGGRRPRERNGDVAGWR